MALVDRERMRDATGAVHLYTPVPDSKPGQVPEYPHPAAAHEARPSGRGLHPCGHIRDTIARYLDWCAAEGVEPDCPVDGDETARFRALQCWDDEIGRAPKARYSGSAPCEDPECPHPQPHCSGQWFSDRWPRFGDIAHVLYPGGILPVPVDDELPEPEPVEPEQLDLLEHLASLEGAPA